MNEIISSPMTSRRSTYLALGCCILTLTVAPLCFGSGAGLSVLCQIGTAIIFGLSYNMLLGQAGMLSFGHAVYSGLGAFCVVHIMNLSSAHSWPIPIALMPLIGGIAGAAFALIFGYITTRQSGIASSMITLGLVELVSASSLMFAGFFGGEGGVSTNRATGGSLFGWTFASQIEVYYLIAAWLLVAASAMYAFTGTPLGRLSNAVRDNAERTEFLGYDPRLVRYLVVVASAFFAGIAGALAAINFEIVGTENVGTQQSGLVLLFTIIGGIGYFWGPMLGAIIGVLLTVVLSAYTKAWHLYLGLVFLGVVLFAPGGVAGCFATLTIAGNGAQVDGKNRPARIQRVFGGKCAADLTTTFAFTIAGLIGAIGAIEMLYQRTLEASTGNMVRIASFSIDSTDYRNWIVAGLLLSFGSMGPLLKKRWFRNHLPNSTSSGSSGQ